MMWVMPQLALSVQQKLTSPRSCRLFMLMLGVLIVMPVSGCAQPIEHEVDDTIYADSIRSIVESVALRQGVVGLRAAVLYQGELIYAESFGVADLEHQVPVTDKTKFLIASITKTFTGAAILKLVEEGKIDLDVPIQEYVPSFPVHSGHAITPRLLIQHQGGIRRYRAEELNTWVLFSQHFDSATEALEIFQADDLAVSPGTRQYYTSFGYNLLAAAVETVTEQTFPAYLEQTFFQPLGLEETMVPDVRVPIPHRARSYLYTNPETGAEDSTLYRGRELDFSYNFGGGYVLSTAEDLVRYGRNFRKPGLLTASSLDLIYGEAEEFDPAASFGWTVVDDSTQGRVIHATGASEAFLAGMNVWIDHDLVVAIVSNTWGHGSRSGELNYQVPFRIGALLLADEE